MVNKKQKMQIIILLVYILSTYTYTSGRPNDSGKSSAWLFKQITIFNICGSQASSLCAAEVEDCMTFYGINPFQSQVTPPGVETMCAGMPFNECALKMSKCTDLFESKEPSGAVDPRYPEGTSEYVNPGNSDYGSSVYPSEVIGFRYTGNGSPVGISNTGNYRFGGFSSEAAPGEANRFRQGNYGHGSFIRGSLGSNGELLGSVGSGHGGFVLPSEPGDYAGLGYSGYLSSQEPGPAGLVPASSASSAGSGAFGLAQDGLGLGSYEEPSQPAGIRVVNYSDGVENDGFGPFIEVSDSLTSGYGKFGLVNSELSGPGIGGFESLAETNETFTPEHYNFSSTGEHNESSGFGDNDGIDSRLGGSGIFRESNETSSLGYNQSVLSKEAAGATETGFREIINFKNSEQHSSGSAVELVEYPSIADFDSTSFNEPSKAEELEYIYYDSPGEPSGVSGLEKDSLEPFSAQSGLTVSGLNLYRPYSAVTGLEDFNQNGNVRPDHSGPSRHPTEVKVSGQLNFESTEDLGILSDSGHSRIGSVVESSNFRESDYSHFDPSEEISNSGGSEFGVFASPIDPIDAPVVESNGFRPLEVTSELRDTDHDTSSSVRPMESTDLTDEVGKSSERFSAHGGFLSHEEPSESIDPVQDNSGSLNAPSESDGKENVNSNPTADHREFNATEPTLTDEQGPISVTQSTVVDDIVSSADSSNSRDSTNFDTLMAELPNIPDRLEALNLSAETVNDRLSILYACAVRNITKCLERADKCFQLSSSEVDIASKMKDLSTCLKFMEDFVKTSTEMQPSPPDCKGERCEACNIMLEPTTDFIATAQACSGVLTGTYTMKKCMKSTMEHHLRTVTTAAIQPKILSAFKTCYQEYSFEQIHPCLVNGCSKIT